MSFYDLPLSCMVDLCSEKLVEKHSAGEVRKLSRYLSRLLWRSVFHILLSFVRLETSNLLRRLVEKCIDQSPYTTRSH